MSKIWQRGNGWKRWPVFNTGPHGIIDSAYVFSSSFLGIVSRTSNMPFILVLSLWYVKYSQYHPITAWEAGRSERQTSRTGFHLTQCLFLVLDFACFHLTYSKFALLKGTVLVFICIGFNLRRKKLKNDLHSLLNFFKFV